MTGTATAAAAAGAPPGPPRGGRPGLQAAALDRASTAERVADLLRERALTGELRPGTQVPEVPLTAALGVSRNTLREAFQILIGERLCVREPHRGVFVRQLTAEDVRDLYRFRRVVECAALSAPVSPAGVAALRTPVEAGLTAAREGRWGDVATADVDFHRAVVATAGSERLDLALRASFAELRLAFALVGDRPGLHGPFLDRNAEMVDLVARGDSAGAGLLMRHYLDDAEEMVVAAVEEGRAGAPEVPVPPAGRGR